MKILILILSFMSVQAFAQNSLSRAEIKSFQQFMGVETNPTCGAPGDPCQTFSDCCRGYCDGNDQCSKVDNATTHSTDIQPMCALSGQACFMNTDCCNSWCKIEKVCF